MGNLYRSIMKSIATVMVCSMVGLLLLLLVFLLPDAPVQKNLRYSAYILGNELDYPIIDTINGPRQLDNFTDALMLSEAGSQFGTSLIDRVLSSYYFYVNGKSQFPSFLLYYNHPEQIDRNEEERTPVSYARYWHGYIIILRPLLLFLRYYQIRKLYFYVQMGALILIAILLWRKGHAALIIPLLASVYYLAPQAVGKSLQFSSVYFIVLFSLLMILIFDKATRKYKEIIFTFFGCMTSYFDFLTAPVLTIGFPLILFLCLHSEQRSVHNAIKLILAWGIGYGGMWAMKWILATGLTGQNILQNGINEVSVWTAFEDEGGKFTYLDVVERNWGFYCRSIVDYVLLLAVVLYVIVITVKRRNKLSISWMIQIAGILMIPFAWLFFASNHVWRHAFFAYRTLCIIPFCLAMFTENSCEIQTKYPMI